MEELDFFRQTGILIQDQKNLNRSPISSQLLLFMAWREPSKVHIPISGMSQYIPMQLSQLSHIDLCRPLTWAPMKSSRLGTTPKRWRPSSRWSRFDLCPERSSDSPRQSWTTAWVTRLVRYVRCASRLSRLRYAEMFKWQLKPASPSRSSSWWQRIGSISRHLRSNHGNCLSRQAVSEERSLVQKPPRWDRNWRKSQACVLFWQAHHLLSNFD